MKKFFSLIAAVLFAGSMMAADATMTAGTNGSACTVNNVDGIKCGTSSKGGDMTITVGAGATKLTFYAAAWKGVTGLSLNLAADGVTFSQASVSLTADDGISNNSPFTLVGSAEAFKFEVNLTGVSAETTIAVTSSAAKRFVVWGATYETGEVTPSDPVEEYYLVGSMNEWEVSADYKLTRNTAAEGNEYKIDITLTEGNQEMKVKGVLEGREEDAWYPGGTNNNFTINDAGDYTIYFRPNADGGDGWHEGCIFAEYHAPAEPITCLEVYQMAKNDVVDLLNDVVVTYANGKNVWVRDETASMLLFLSANTTWKAGDVLSGVAGVVDIYNGVTEIKPTAAQVAAVTATEGEAPAAIELAAVEAADVNKYIVMKNIAVNGTFAEGTASNITLTLGESSVVLRNNFKNGFAFDAEKTYDIYGVVTIYQSNPQIYFITAEEHVATAIENTNAAVKATKVIENGKLVIIKNGVRYDAQGARL